MAMEISWLIVVSSDEVKPAKKLAHIINAIIKNAEKKRFTCSFLPGFFMEKMTS